MIDSASRIGRDCNIEEAGEVEESVLSDEVVVQAGSRVVHCELGKKVQLDRNNSILYSKLGRYCYTGPNTTIRGASLGSFNSISWNVSIGGNNHDLNHITTHSFLVYDKWGMGAQHGNWKSAFTDCIIGNDVWIAAGAAILRDVHIGDGAVIGAGAIVTKDVPPYAIVAGCPAKIIRMRCPDEMIEELLALKWWEFPEEVIREEFALFQGELTMDVIKQLSARKKEMKGQH